jgi:hypothetical protein
MHLLPTLTTLLLILSTTHALLQDALPRGYKVTNVIPVPEASRWPEVQDNEDNIPLVNAELKCTITPYGYYLKGRWWTGVSEHWIKKVIWYTKGPIGKRVRGVGMYDWKFQKKELEGIGRRRLVISLFLSGFLPIFPSFFLSDEPIC